MNDKVIVVRRMSDNSNCGGMLIKKVLVRFKLLILCLQDEEL